MALSTEDGSRDAEYMYGHVLGTITIKSYIYMYTYTYLYMYIDIYVYVDRFIGIHINICI
jgi:hypothetical protein